MADPTKAWHKAFTSGSKSLQDRLKKVHAKNPEFQKFLSSRDTESGKSASQAKAIKPAEKKAAAPMSSVRQINAARMKKYYEKGGRQPIGAGGSGGNSITAGMDASSVKGIKAGIKAGFNPKARGLGEGFDPDPKDIAAYLVSRHGKGKVTQDHVDAYERRRDSHRGIDKEEVMKHVKKLSEETESTTEVNEMSSHGKKLAKMIMAKKSQHPIAQHMGEAADDSREYDYEGDMAKSQLKSIITNAQKLHDSLEDNTNLPEWVQLKITLAEDYVVTAANYMEGELDEETLQRRANTPKDGMTRLAFRAQTKDEVRANHVRIYKKMQKDDPAKAERFKEKYLQNEDVDQIDEKMDLAKTDMGDVIKDFKASDAPQFKGKSPEKRREMAIAAKLEADRGAKNEEVEQVDEKYMGFKKVMAAAKKGGARDPAAVAAAIGRKKYGKEKFQAMAAAGKRAANEETEVVAEAEEGSVPTTPKEKELAAHHGDPNRITYGDVIKARLKAAAKKGK